MVNFSKINKRPVPNKDVLGGNLSKNNKNVLDYYLADKSTLDPSVAFKKIKVINCHIKADFCHDIIMI